MGLWSRQYRSICCVQEMDRIQPGLVITESEINYMALIQVKARWQIGDKPFSDPVMAKIFDALQSHNELSYCNLFWNIFAHILAILCYELNHEILLFQSLGMDPNNMHVMRAEDLIRVSKPRGDLWHLFAKLIWCSMIEEPGYALPNHHHHRQKRNLIVFLPGSLEFLKTYVKLKTC